MHAVLEFLVGQPTLLLFLLVGIGSTVGHFKVRGISLGAAAVLFVAMGVAAAAVGSGIAVDSPEFSHLLEVLEIVGSLGLALFTFCVGIISGPNFFASLRTGLGPILGSVVALVASAAVAVGVGSALQLPSSLVAGAFAGSVTNTPALAAAIDSAGNPSTNSPTVGYSVTYFFGVLAVLGLSMLALRRRTSDRDTPDSLTSLTVRVDRSDRPRMRDIEAWFDERISFSRVRRGDTNPIRVAVEEEVLELDDLVAVVGPRELVDQVARELGHHSSHKLEADRHYLDMRRITLSTTKLAGHTIAELDLAGRFGATASRVRRGDVDMLAHDSLILQTGDRLRVVGPTGRMSAISRYLGDSARGLSDVNPITLGLGMTIGFLLGTIEIPIGTGFSLGSAAGTLLVGLVLGRLGRIGPLVTTLPHTAATVLSEFGLLVFLAFAGARAGGQIVTYWDGDQILRLLVVGAASTVTLGVVTFLAMRRIFRMGGTKLAGVLGGVQTQPAILAYANGRTAYDSRVALGYALVYPTSMVVKILLGQFLGGL